MSESGLRLNFACGAARWPGFVNSDTNGEPGTEYVDLEVFPYPYEDGSADLILISHGLFMGNHGVPCHPDHESIMEEFYRILRPGGWLRIDDNPFRCPDPSEELDEGQKEAEAGRGYPERWNLPRKALKLFLSRSGFKRVEGVREGETLTGETGETLEAILGNRLGHYSFTVEAQK